MKKVCCIFGTRPEAIKMAPLIRLLKKEPSVQCHVCVTAQHREMLDQVLTAFDITPDVDFNNWVADKITLRTFPSIICEHRDL